MAGKKKNPLEGLEGQDLINKAILEEKVSAAAASVTNTSEQELVSPETIFEEVQEPETFQVPKRRGRKPKADKDVTTNLTGVLWLVHKGISKLTGVEEFEISGDESKELADAIASVQALYPASALSVEAMAWTKLAVVAGTIYGTRVIAYSNNKKRSKKTLELVTPLPPGTVKVNEV